MNRFIYMILITIALISSISACKSVKSLSKEEKATLVKKKINTQNYTFEAQKALPTSGSSIDLASGGYTLRVNKDSVIAYLPYFGRAYVAPMNPNEGAIKFTSTAFCYKSNFDKNNKWDINIETNDTQGKVRLHLSIFANGTGSLNVYDNNRQPILFYGEIAE